MTLLILVTFCTGCSRHPGEQETRHSAAERLNAEGLYLISLGDFEGSLEKLKQAVTADPNDAAFLSNLAYSLYRTGDYDAAIVAFETVLDMNPEDALAYFDYGRCLGKAGLYEAALPQLLNARKFGENDPKYSLMLLELSLCQESLGLIPKAVETMKGAVEKFPRADLHTRLGDLLFADGDTEAAEKEYHKAIVTTPGYAPAMNNLGLMLTSSDRTQEGMKFFRMVIDRDPFNPAAHSNLAMEHWALGDLDSALEEIEKATKFDPGNALYHFHNAVFLHDAGFEDEALEELRISLEINPEYPEAATTLKEWTGG